MIALEKTRTPVDIWWPLSDDSGPLLQMGTRKFSGISYVNTTRGYPWQRGKCYQFDGASHYVNTGVSDSEIMANNYGISFMLRVDASSADESVVMSCIDTTALTGFRFVVDRTTGYLRLDWYDSGTTLNIGEFPGAVDGRWHHVAFLKRDTVVGSTYTNTWFIYLDGNRVGMASNVLARNTSARTLYFGAEHGPANFFIGELADVRIYSTQDEGVVLESFHGDTRTFANTPYPDHWWKCDDVLPTKDGPETGLILHNKLGSLTEFENSEVGPDGTNIGGMTLTFQSAKFGNGVYIPYYKTAASDWFGFSGVAFPKKGTLEMWMKLDWTWNGTSASDGLVAHTIFTMQSPDNVYMPLSWYMHDGEGSHFDMYDESNGNMHRLTMSDLVFNSGQLYHVALVWEDASSGGFMKVYVDGVERASQALSITYSGTFNARVSLIQREYYADYGLSGVMDNIKLYSIAKSSFTDRNTEASSGLVSFHKVENEGSLPYAEVKGVDLLDMASDGEIINQFKGRMTHRKDKSSYALYPNKTYIESAYNALTAFEYNSPWSASFWAMAPSGVAQLSVSNKVLGTDAGWALYLRLGVSDSWVYFDLTHDYSGGDRLYRGIQYLSTAQKRWYHIAITYDGSNTLSGVHVYIDGVEVVYNLEHAALTGSVVTSNPVRIGNNALSDAGVTSIFDFHLFNRAIDIVEIKRAMECAKVGGELLYYPMQEAEIRDHGKLPIHAGIHGRSFMETIDATECGKYSTKARKIDATKGVQMLHVIDYSGERQRVRSWNSLTLAAWFKGTTLASGEGFVPFFKGASSATLDYSVDMNNGVPRYFCLTNQWDLTYAPFIPGKWYNIVVTVDRLSAEICYYINGRLVTRIATAGYAILQGTFSSLYMGGWFNGGYGCRDAIFKDLMMWNERALTAQEVLSLYEEGNIRFHTEGVWTRD